MTQKIRIAPPGHVVNQAKIYISLGLTCGQNFVFQSFPPFFFTPFHSGFFGGVGDFFLPTWLTAVRFELREGN